MWWGIVLILSGVGAHFGDLMGENVCTRKESYTVTFEKPVVRNVTVREYVWCLGVPPRCSKYHTILKTEFKVIKENRTRNTQFCCPSYKEDSTGVFCIPACSNCNHGECVKPEQCECNSGYTGFACNLKCAPDKWGRNCMQECDCRNGAACDPDTGNCHCVDGWTGPTCDMLLNETKANAFKYMQQECFNCDKLVTTQLTPSSEASVLYNETAPEELNLPSSTQEPETEEINVEINNNLESTDVKADIPHVTTSAKMKVYGKSRQEENSEQWLMDEMRTFPKQKPTVRNLHSGIIIAIALTAFIIFFAVITVLIVRYKNRRYIAKKCHRETEQEEKPVVYRKSTFNIPLPDPPILENQIFTVTLDEKRNSTKLFSPQQNQMYNNVRETTMDLQYDYPPSTGSYRAASVPDPDTEPLYDEIPSTTRAVTPLQQPVFSKDNSFINLSFAGLNTSSRCDN